MIWQLIEGIRMTCLYYKNNELYIENVALKDIAEKVGTPTYIYSKAVLESNWHTFNDAFKDIPHRICYAVKANSNISILNLFAKLNSGFDIVSQGELTRVIVAGGDPKKIIFSGVGKQQIEIEQAIKSGIYCFNIESHEELERINTIAARLGTVVNIALRMNPNVNPKTHAHISTGLSENKFGIDIHDIIPLCQQLSSFQSLQLIGIASHIGSQIIDLEPFLLNIDKLLEIYQQLQNLGIPLQHINIGGGLGISYHKEQPPAIYDYAKAVQAKINSYPLEVIIEPGRAMVGNTGALLTRVEYLKQNGKKNFAIVDAGMNDLIRPALYDAWHDILPVFITQTEKKHYEIAGPVCESADFFGKNRELAVHAGDLLAIDSTGAYGISMSSNYNSRPRAAEVLVDKQQFNLIRRRETIEDLLAVENLDNKPMKEVSF